MIFKFNLYQRAFSIILLCPLIVFFHVNVTFAQTVVSNKGDITGLPLPRFVSVKSNKVNVRRGPNSTYQIDWVYTRAGVPLKITAEYGNWRRVEDFQGEGGWIHARLLSGKRFVIFLEKESILKRRPNKKAPSVAIIQQGVIGRFLSIAGNWCQVSVEGYSGWVSRDLVWGAIGNKTSEH